MTRIGPWVLLAGLAACLPACEQSETGGGGDVGTTTQPAEGVSFEEVKGKTQEAAEAAWDYAKKKKEQCREWAEKELPELDRRIQEMKELLKEKAEDARPEVEQRLDELGQSVDEARERFEKLKDASGPAWEEAKEGLEGAIEQLQKALDQAHPDTQPATQPIEPEAEAPPE